MGRPVPKGAWTASSATSDPAAQRDRKRYYRSPLARSAWRALAVRHACLMYSQQCILLNQIFNCQCSNSTFY